MDQVIEFAKTAGPFGAVGASFCLFVVWRQLLKAWKRNEQQTIAGINALNAVNASLKAILVALAKKPRRSIKRRRGR